MEGILEKRSSMEGISIVEKSSIDAELQMKHSRNLRTMAFIIDDIITNDFVCQTDRSGQHGRIMVTTWTRATGVHTAPCARGVVISWSNMAWATNGNEEDYWLPIFLTVQRLESR
ncbi:hypothetical protein LXL04_032463 [Taraxacum kok-saghyz]